MSRTSEGLNRLEISRVLPIEFNFFMQHKLFQVSLKNRPSGFDKNPRRFEPSVATKASKSCKKQHDDGDLIDKVRRMNRVPCVCVLV